MKLVSFGLFALVAVIPLRAQSLFTVVEDGNHYLVKSVENKQPLIAVNGQLRPAVGQTFILVKAPIYGLGVVDVGAFKVAVASTKSANGQPQLHVSGVLKADTALKHCFFVVRVPTDTGKTVICDALPDFAPNQDVVYDSLFDLPPHSQPGEGHFEVLVFSNGLQQPTSLMAPELIAQQKAKTETYLKSHAAR